MNMHSIPNFVNSSYLDLTNPAIKLRRLAVDCGIISSDWDYILTPLVLEASAVASLSRDLAVLENLIYALPERLFSGDEYSFFKSLGLDERLSRYMSHCKGVSRKAPMRWDIIPTDQGFKVIELNTGLAVGGLNVALARQATDDLLFSISQKHHSLSWGNPLLHMVSLFQENSSSFLTAKNILIIDEDEIFDDEVLFIAAIKKYVQDYLPGANVSMRPLSKLVWENKCLVVDSKPVDFIICMIPAFELVELFEKNQNLYSLFNESDVPLALNPAEAGYSSKSILSLLWDNSNWSQFSEREIEVIQRIIPITRRLRSIMDVPSDYQDWVLKPSHEYGGVGVICGWEVSRQEFLEKSKDALVSGSAFILQRMVNSSSVSLLEISKNGSLKQNISKPILGIFISGGVITGGCTRAFISKAHSGVVNASQGAAFGPILFEGI